MSTTNANPAPTPAKNNQNTQMMYPSGIDADGNVEMIRIYFDGGMTKAKIAKLRTLLADIEDTLA